MDYAADLKAVCAEKGIMYGIWETFPDPAQDRVTTFGADLYIAEGEKNIDWPSVCKELRARHPNIPAATVTNFTVMETHLERGLANISALLEHRFACIGECYLSENPNATPEAIAFEAIRRGWSNPSVVVGIYGGKVFADYDLRGRSHWIWLAETVSDWSQFDA